MVAGLMAVPGVLCVVPGIALAPGRSGRLGGGTVVADSVAVGVGVVVAAAGAGGGGLGGAVAEVVGEEYPVPVLRHGMRDCFGKSGKHDDVLALFGLTETVLADTVRRAAALKK